MSILAIIPARGGSKGVPRKNIKPLCGKPLIAWSIEAAKESKYIDRVVVSTDDDEIAAIALSLNADVPFMRPSELAADDSPGVAVVLHALENLTQYDWVCLLQPTSPLRTVKDIDSMIEFCLKRDVESAVSVCEVSEHPYWMKSMDAFNRLKPIIENAPKVTRRQDLPQVFKLNGAIYLAKSKWLKQKGDLLSSETIAYLMPTDRSVDIDSKQDWLFAEFLMGYLNEK